MNKRLLKIYFGFLLVLLISCEKSMYPERSKQKYIAKERELLKEYAYCNCVLHALKEDSIVNKDISGAIYVNISHYDDSAYAVIMRLSRNAADSIKPPTYVDYIGKLTVLYDCNNFKNSKSLDSIVRSMDKKINKPAW